MDISILYPPGAKAEQFLPISDTTWHDLGFDLVMPLLTRDVAEQTVIRQIMTFLCADPAVAKYRIEVFDDLIRHEELRNQVQALLDRIRQLEDRMSLRNTFEQSDSIWTLMRRLREIDEYIDCVETIGASLENRTLHSEALRNLAAYIRDIREASEFAVLREDIRNLRVMTSKVKSITLGINLDENYETHSIGIISLNDKPFNKAGLLSGFTNRITSRDQIQKGTDWNGKMSYQPVDTTNVAGVALAAFEKTTALFAASVNPLIGIGIGLSQIKLNDPGRQTVRTVESVMNQMMSDSVRSLKDVLSKYVTVDIHSITNLIPEFMYYVRWADYITKLRNQGYVFSKSHALTTTDDLTLYAHDIYNLKLAVTGSAKPQEIVANDLIFSPAQNCYLLTGANRGGKTTITQAVGQAMILAQGGIYVPGDGLDFVPADQIFTHFPADEDKTMDYGRLGEECSRFREIYNSSTNLSLILLNESFSTTSFEEGYYIAYDAVRALLRKGCRTIFNTHMHKLAREVDALNSDPSITVRAASLIMKNEGSKRSYKLAVAPPEGTSYARDIAEKYGLTYEQLIQPAGELK